MDSFEGGSCAMYAFEKEIPKISQIKLDGSCRILWYFNGEDATEYFQVTHRS